MALKLLKRYLTLRYDELPLERPPSIYLTKRAGDVGFVEQGVTAQLFILADSTARILRDHLASGTRPEELNPSYPKDRINDRWPGEGAQGHRDMQGLAESLEYLAERLNEMATATLADISKTIDELFGERIGKEQRRVLAERYDRRHDSGGILTTPRSGAVKAPAIVTSTTSLREVPRHHFHPFTMDTEDDE